MTSKRFQITCPHCHRSYALSVDPDNLDSATATARCGRCKKRFRLSTAVLASVEKTGKPLSEPKRNTYRKRISRPAMRQLADDRTPGAVVDEIALAFERALQERRRARREAGLAGTEIELPLEGDVADDPVDLEDTATPAEKAPPPTKRRITPQVAFRFTPPPARDILLGSNLGALDDTSPPSHPQATETRATPVADDVAMLPGPRTTPAALPPVTASDGEQSPPSRSSSRPPRPREAEKAPPVAVEAITRDERREAWLALGDEPLENLVAVSSPSVAALEWLLAEDALRDV